MTGQTCLDKKEQKTMSDTKNTENESSGLKKSLRLIYVYAIAAGAIFTFIGYWDTIFYEYCGASPF
jgi:hypothetical protein